MATFFISAVLACFTLQNLARAEQQCDAGTPEKTPVSRFEINQTDGTVFDTKTKLTWKVCSEGQNYSGGHCTGGATNFTWDDAMQTFGDAGDSWRLPSVDELGSLVEDRCRNPAINMAIFTNETETHFWSARNTEFSWGVNFDEVSFVTYVKAGNNLVRLVRGEKWVDTLKDERERVNLAARLQLTNKTASVTWKAALRKKSKDKFCMAYGKVLRGEEVNEIGESVDEEVIEIGELLPAIDMQIAMKLAKAEALHRKLVFNDSLIRKEQVRIGMSECQLYAAWGLPSDQNRTVGSWGIHIQHIYGNAYVYTENGRVTSWQD